MNFRHMDGYKLYTSCRFCGRKLQKPVIDLGKVPLAGGFIKDKKQFKSERLFPLTVSFCENCYLLQVREVISADTLFKNYFYFSSAIKTLKSHFEQTVINFAKEVKKPSEKLIVEIGSNDGSFIREALRQGFKTIGVDPAGNVVKPLIKEGLPILNEYFTNQTAKKIVKKFGKADIIFSSNTLAHIEDMHEVYKGIETLLKDDGILVFENHYLGNLVKEMQFDMIYHEHQYYYSLNSISKFLKEHNMEVFDLKFIPIHAGSIRFYVQKEAGRSVIKKIVTQTLKLEKKYGLTSPATFVSFNKKILKNKEELQKLIRTLKKKNKRIAGYGASGRGTILGNFTNLNNKVLDYVIDDAPAKQGAYTPGNHLEIVGSNVLKEIGKPDFVVLFAWSFWKEIKKKNLSYIKSGGKFIIPLPKVKII